MRVSSHPAPRETKEETIQYKGFHLIKFKNSIKMNYIITKNNEILYKYNIIEII